MKLTTLALASVFALSSTFALANGQRHHHHWRNSMNSMHHLEGVLTRMALRAAQRL
jgi:hypothetical protein